MLWYPMDTHQEQQWSWSLYHDSLCEGAWHDERMLPGCPTDACGQEEQCHVGTEHSGSKWRCDPVLFSQSESQKSQSLPVSALGGLSQYKPFNSHLVLAFQFFTAGKCPSFSELPGQLTKHHRSTERRQASCLQLWIKWANLSTLWRNSCCCFQPTCEE